jgi:hypothetical protein
MGGLIAGVGVEKGGEGFNERKRYRLKERFRLRLEGVAGAGRSVAAAGLH